jgi:hypothetical protein
MKEILDLLEIAAVKAARMWVAAETESEAARLMKCRLTILEAIKLAKGDVQAWKPKEGEIFYFITPWLEVGELSVKVPNDFVSESVVSAGNRFPTRDAAEARIPAVKAALKGKS